MKKLKDYQVWFVTGSQNLYGEETLKQVAKDSQVIADSLAKEKKIPVTLVNKPVLTGPGEIKKLCLEANSDPKCVGIITWMHTFSPARMWIAGLRSLEKPFLHLHTQFNREIPWTEIDMDYMNLNQSAHGGREFGFMASRMRLNRKVVVGHWQDEDVIAKLAVWMRAACAWQDAQEAKIARFGDNMRQVAVTEGDKVEAQLRLGYTVNGYGIGDLVELVEQVSDQEIAELIEQYENQYRLQESLKSGGEKRESLKEAAKIELGLRRFLKEGNFQGFTTTFEVLHGISQLPGLAVQRLMADGYGFGAEGDWKTAALVRAMKVMAAGLEGGTSFMEHYTYHLAENNVKVLGAHMLEVCETIAEDKPSMEIHPLGIGGKADPVRLVFNTPAGPAVNASVVDMGNRFRMIVNPVEVVKPDQDLPKLPVARVLWQPQPDMQTAVAAWIHAGGAHHTGFSQALSVEHLQDFAEMAGIEFLLIDEKTNLNDFQKELRWNEVYYHLNRGF